MSLPRVTPSAIKGLLSGDDHCLWAAWYRAHHRRYKKPDSDFDFAQWREAHTRLLKQEQESLEADGHYVVIEAEFEIHGTTAIVAGKIDLISQTVDDPEEPVKILDGKTGKRSDKDVWQVRIYMAVAPMQWPDLKTKKVIGEVLYESGPRQSVSLSNSHQTLIWECVKDVAGGEPRTTPSKRECGFCDILDCDDRTRGVTPGTAAGAF